MESKQRHIYVCHIDSFLKKQQKRGGLIENFNNLRGGGG